MKSIFIIGVLISLLSCSSEKSILGKWGSVQLITKTGKEVISLNISKDDFRYSTWEFNPDGNLFMGKYKARYSINNDTINITAENGFISVVPIVKLTSNELRLRELSMGDSVVTVLKRID
jgi:hypothetical protein